MQDKSVAIVGNDNMTTGEEIALVEKTKKYIVKSDGTEVMYHRLKKDFNSYATPIGLVSILSVPFSVPLAISLIIKDDFLTSPLYLSYMGVLAVMFSMFFVTAPTEYESLTHGFNDKVKALNLPKDSSDGVLYQAGMVPVSNKTGDRGKEGDTDIITTWKKKPKAIPPTHYLQESVISHNGKKYLKSVETIAPLGKWEKLFKDTKRLGKAKLEQEKVDLAKEV